MKGFPDHPTPRTFLHGLGQSLKGSGGWLLLNVLGIGAYWVIECWVLAPFRDDQGDPVRDWLGTTFPLLSLYLGINATWLIMKMKEPCFGRRSLLVWLLVGLAWGIILCRDPINAKALFEILEGSAWP